MAALNCIKWCYAGNRCQMWSLLSAVASLAIALSLSFLAVILISVVVLVWLALLASLTARES